MRQIYTYQIVRYFPHVLSDEFINIGVFLTSQRDQYRILNEEEAKHIHCSALIGDRKKFLGVVNYVQNLAESGTLVEGEHYFHNFRFSHEQKIASEKTAKEVVEELFDDYVGFKIDSEKKREQKEIILETSIRLVEHSFKKYVRLRKSHKFDLELESIKAGIIHHSNAGRSSWKNDVSAMVMETPTKKNKKDRYDFLDITGKIDMKNPYVQKLQHNYVDIYPYQNEEDIAAYMEQIAQVA